MFPALDTEAAFTSPRRHRLLLLGALTALAPISTDLNLPFLPSMGQDLAASQPATQASISAVLLGIALGQLVIGPLSDSLGRRLPVLVGGSTYVVASIASAAAPRMEYLLAFRFIAGVSCAAGMVVSRAIVTDVYRPIDAARAYATLAAIVTIVPAIAPVVGGLLAPVVDWRAAFIVMAVLGLALVLSAQRWLDESLPISRRHPARLSHTLASVGGLLRSRRFVGYVVALAGSGGVLFGYIAASSFVLQSEFGLSPTAYGFAFAVNALGIFGLANLSRRLVGRTGPRRLLLAGQCLTLVGVLILAVGVAFSTLTVVLFGLFTTVSSVGLIVANSMALGMREAADRAGAAAGLLGILQFTVGGVMAVLTGIGGSSWSMVIALAASAVLGPSISALLVHDRKSAAPK